MSRIFDGFNASFDCVCPICKTGEDKQTVLIPIDGTENGNICRAEQVHLDCLLTHLGYKKDHKIIYAICEG